MTGTRRLRRVVQLAGEWRKELRYGVASGITQQVLFIAGAGIAAYVAGRAVRGATYDQLALYLLGLVVIVLPQVRTPWLESLTFQAIGNRVQVQLRQDIFGALERLTPAGLDGRRSGQLGSTAMADVTVIQHFLAETLSTLIVAAVVPALVVVAVAALSWPLAILLLPFLLLAAYLPRWRPVDTSDREEASPDRLGALSADVVDAVQGLRELVTFGAQDAVRRELWERGQQAETLRATRANHLGGQRLMADLISTSGAIAVLVAGAALVHHHALRPAFLPPLTLLAALAFAPIGRLVQASNGLGGVADSADRIFALLDAPAPVPESRAEGPAQLAGASVEYRSVVFRYGPKLPAALDQVSFAIQAGETIALVGHSGSGKSTCVNLLLRFWDVEHGLIAIGGVDVRDIDSQELHRLVGFVPQDVYLFNITIRENLRLGRPEATDVEIEDAARAAVAWEFIAALPDGLDTITGERAAQLSGGERQRVAIARAFLADPPVLVLDEPVANLDSDNEQALAQAMSRLRAGRTTLIVAHRLSTIRSADRIVVLDGGRVAQIGTHADLLERRGPYARLVAAQLSSAPPRA